MIAKFSDTAIIDIQDIANYLAKNASVDIALAVIDQIETTIHETLLANPEIGVVLPMPDAPIRAFPTQKYRIYTIFYTVEPHHIRILHTNRDIPKLLNEHGK